MKNAPDDAEPTALRAAIGKAKWRILPLLGLCYLIAYMDRVNISFAATQMNDALGFSATIYGIGGGLFFLAYGLFEVPSNMAMLRVGPRRWIARIMISWGILAAGMMFVRTPMQFYVLRFLVGMAEAGFFPCAVYYLSSWFPRAERARAISWFYLFGPLAAVVMGALSGWLLSLDGLHGLRGWQWLLLMEGLPGVGVGMIVLYALPDAPPGSHWLDEAERGALAAQLARDTSRTDGPPPHDLRAILGNPRVRLLAMMGFLTIGAFYPFILSAPKILMIATGMTIQTIGWLVTLGGIVGAVAMALAGWVMDRQGDRFPTLIAMIIAEAIALVVLALAPGIGPAVGAYLVLSAATWVVSLAQVAIWADILRERELSIGAALINSVSQIGAFVSPIVFGMMKDRTGAYTAGLLTLPVMLALLLGLVLILRRQVRPQPQLQLAIT